MEKYFCDYNQSLALKELGFAMPCLMYIDDEEDLINDDTAEWIGAVKCPLKSQVFEWFRKYKLSVVIHDLRDDYEANIIEWTLDDDKISYGFLQPFETYEEAESACIDKLIEIVQNGR